MTDMDAIERIKAERDAAREALRYDHGNRCAALVGAGVCDCGWNDESELRTSDLTERIDNLIAERDALQRRLAADGETIANLDRDRLANLARAERAESDRCDVCDEDGLIYLPTKQGPEGEVLEDEPAMCPACEGTRNGPLARRVAALEARCGAVIPAAGAAGAAGKGVTP